MHNEITPPNNTYKLTLCPVLIAETKIQCLFKIPDSAFLAATWNVVLIQGNTIGRNTGVRYHKFACFELYPIATSVHKREVSTLHSNRAKQSRSERTG
jgi:hypothetical protein